MNLRLYTCILTLIILVFDLPAQKTFFGKDFNNKVGIIDTDKISQTVYFIGGLDLSNENSSSTLNAIRSFSKKDISQKRLVFLGNNYSKGDFDINAFPAITKELKNSKTDIIFINGENEYDVLKNRNVNILECPEPKIVELDENNILIIVDTRWYLNHDNDQIKENCPIKNEIDFIDALKESIQNNLDKNIILCSHHPVVNFGQSKRQMHHPKYKLLKEKIEYAIEDHSRLIVVSGHDNSQQLINDENYFIISGNGDRGKSFKKGKTLDFASSGIGFTRVLFLKNGSAIV
ncbi:MAG: hypothetical protein MRY83_20785, partial [Flavobacteriales bacterium]|nr:hypothetical protein [Flavobacteriales bacterium]